MSNLDPEKCYRSVNSIDFDNKIRTEADEISYHLHIVLRFELERKLINGEIEVEDLPDLWNRKTSELLDVEVESDLEGILQDIHWGWGHFGYFPTYSLGSVLAAQLYEAVSEDVGNVEDKIREGNFDVILDWLRENIHRHGQMYSTEELIERSTKEELTADPFLDYIRRKYSDLYGVDLNEDN